MKKSIIFRRLKGDSAIIDHIDRRLSFAFARSEHAIQTAAVTISDVNGPKGGIDKQCRVVIKPNGLPRIVISEKQASTRLAIDRSISRASQSLARHLKRKQHALRRQFSLKRAPVDLDQHGYS
jgi:hypothetical protein